MFTVSTSIMSLPSIGQLEIGALGGDFGFRVFTLFVLAKIHFFVASAHGDFHGGHLAGVVTLEGTGKAQRHGIDRAPLLKHQFIQAAHRPFQRQRVVVQAESMEAEPVMPPPR
jgi:hypothetical protein